MQVTDEFTEHVYDGAISIEVYGHSSEEGQAVIGRSLADRWSEVCFIYVDSNGMFLLFYGLHDSNFIVLNNFKLIIIFLKDLNQML